MLITSISTVSLRQLVSQARSSSVLVRTLHISCSARNSSNGNGKSNADPSSLAASRAAYEQRKLLETIRARGGSAASNASIASASPSREKLNATQSLAAAALSAGSSAGPSMAGGLMGAPMNAGAGGGALDRAAGGGKKWKELRGSEKVVRAGLNSGRLTMIIIGGTLTLAVVWAVSTELFARNSPTVIYNDACKRIKSAPELYEQLLPPIRFSSSSSASPVNPRGTSSKHHVILPAADSRDTMLMRFFLTSKEAGREWTMWETARESVVDAARWSKESVIDAAEAARDWYEGEEHTQGDRVSGGLSDAFRRAQEKVQQKEEEKPKSKGWLAATFGGLSRITPNAITRTKREPGTWASGEVHAELQKDEDGIFQYKSLFVDVPNTQAAMRQRVWIIRKKGEVNR